jgi:hypothetical protein
MLLAMGHPVSTGETAQRLGGLPQDLAVEAEHLRGQPGGRGAHGGAGMCGQQSGHPKLGCPVKGGTGWAELESPATILALLQ